MYLVEVQKKAGFIGGGKAEFKLLACQRSEQSWTAVPGEESVPAPDDAANYSAGTLVMVELNNNRQVQRHYEAGRPLVSILQNFSSLNKKYKTQEEEIEQWKQSLTFQSQELNRREMEIETRQEQLEQAEADLEKLEAQRQEVEQSRQDLTQLQEELTRKNQDLEGAWAHLNGEMRRLEERQAEFSQQGGLDEGQVNQLQESLNRLMGAVTPTEALREKVGVSGELINQHQSLLDQHQQGLDQQRAELEEKRQSLEQQATELKGRWEAWFQSNEQLYGRIAELKLQQQLISGKQERLQALSEELHRQGNLHHHVYELLNTSDKVRLSRKVDVAELEAMTLEHLQSKVNDLEKDLEKVSRFVSDQEEELTLEQQAIDELKGRIEQANEFDRLQLETELADEQDRHRMLNETLVGQRRNLLEREEVLSQHQAILRRRQGLATDESPVNSVDLEPLLNTIDEQRQHTTTLMQSLEAELKQIQERMSQLKQEIEQQTSEQQQQRSEIQQFEFDLQQQRDEASTLAGRAQLYEELLGSTQESLNQFRQSLEEIANSVAQFQEASDYQLQAITEMRQTVLSVADNPAQAMAS
nr:pilus motility taxis protein HmpF [Pseudanabaena sp. FACHB-2040]